MHKLRDIDNIPLLLDCKNPNQHWEKSENKFIKPFFPLFVSPKIRFERDIKSFKGRGEIGVVMKNKIIFHREYFNRALSNTYIKLSGKFIRPSTLPSTARLLHDKANNQIKLIHPKCRQGWVSLSPNI